MYYSKSATFDYFTFIFLSNFMSTNHNLTLQRDGEGGGGGQI